MEQNVIWLGVGFLGQALFSARFLVQWLSSERQKRSVVPLAFWYFSLAGGDRKSTRLNSSHIQKSRMPSSA